MEERTVKGAHSLGCCLTQNCHMDSCGARWPEVGLSQGQSLPNQWPHPSLPWVLQVMESVVKNCGQTVHDEVANKQTMEELKELLKVGAW